MLNAVRGFLPKKEVIPAERRKALVAFTKSASLKFNQLALLDMAFHHRSFSNENHGGESAQVPASWNRPKQNPPHPGTRYNNERLEFLGDTVLGLSVAAYLYKAMPEKTEGELSKIKSVVVSEVILSQIALEIGVDSLLVLGKGEELSGGRQKKAILADAVEAVIGAVYLDSGHAAADKFVLSLMVPEINKVIENKHLRDYKTMLQEYCQKKFKHYPEYLLVKKIGPDHDRTFMVAVQLNGQTYGPEKGKNKKEAEQAAAKIACEKLKIKN
ncbi:MAG: ribonuclease III [Spirochaetaceae bacterium]|jgi:ribonuclease-3|nr:ribonuclease III [Spirochaetaceae bacterium]